MTNKISEATKRLVVKMHNGGSNKSEIAKKCGISSRSVGRIIDDTPKNKNVSADTQSKNYEGLLPCPYCGGNAKIRSAHFPENHPIYDKEYYVECTQCHMIAGSVKTGFHDWYNGKANCYVSSAKAIKSITDAWNERFVSERQEDKANV